MRLYGMEIKLARYTFAYIEGLILTAYFTEKTHHFTNEKDNRMVLLFNHILFTESCSRQESTDSANMFY